MNIEIISELNTVLPFYAHDNDAGCDVRAFLGENEDMYTSIKPGGIKLIKTGLKVSIPVGYEIQVRPRSGLALKYGVSIVNSPGTIDSGYKDEIGIILINHGDSEFIIKNGDRIAQFVLSKVNHIEWTPVDEFTLESDRNGGFGSSGIK